MLGPVTACVIRAYRFQVAASATMPLSASLATKAGLRVLVVMGSFFPNLIPRVL